MHEVLRKISDRINAAPDNMDFLHLLLGVHKRDVLAGRPLVLFGAGVIGGELCSTLKNYDIHPVCVCDNDASKAGSSCRDVPIISFRELLERHKKSLILLATINHTSAMAKQLLDHGFEPSLIVANKFDSALSSYITDGTQENLMSVKTYAGTQEVFEFYRRNEKLIAEAYSSFADAKSRDLLIAKLAYMACHENMHLLKDFIDTFSEPVLQFGNIPSISLTENHFYFNNDVFALSEGEILVDVGAFDGDSVEAFVSACEKGRITYGHIYAFEPDPDNYRALQRNTKDLKRISCLHYGLWSESGTLRFQTSDRAAIASSSTISDTGNSEIEVIALDDFLQGKPVSFIKMDPPGLHVICETLRGAAKTIRNNRPRLAIGAYHSLESIFEVPLQVKGICPEYRLYLRHHSRCLNETDLLAFA